ncbi:hypothetical protein HDU97_002658 [Phlyctochytrium planicorne]|nr:hypothetical protein HDU97_002658 [Phlyctochytrium planicorne]
MSNTSREDSGWEDDFDPHTLIGAIVDQDGENSLKLTQLLGSGSYALVYSAEPAHPLDCPISPTSDVTCEQITTLTDSIAVKVLFKRGLSENQMRLQHMEAELLTILGEHQGIVRLRRITEDADFLYLVLDRCDEDLYEAIATSKINGKAPFYDFTDEMDMVESIKDAFGQIAGSVAYCHGRSVYHRDLKPENILTVINPSNGLVTTKLTDFGLATRDRICYDYGTGSSSYTSPEALAPPKHGKEEGYDCAANDVWSLGIVFFNLLTSKNPWAIASLEDQSYAAFDRWFRHVKTLSPQSTVPLSPLCVEFELSDRCDEVFRRVFDPNPKTRCGLKELIELVGSVPRFNATRPRVGTMPLSSSLPLGGDTRASIRSNHVRRNRSWSSDMSNMDFSNVPIFDDGFGATAASRRMSRASILSIHGMDVPSVEMTFGEVAAVTTSVVVEESRGRNSPIPQAGRVVPGAPMQIQTNALNLRRPLLPPPSPGGALNGSRLASPQTSSFASSPFGNGNANGTGLVFAKVAPAGPAVASNPRSGLNAAVANNSGAAGSGASGIYSVSWRQRQQPVPPLPLPPQSQAVYRPPGNNGFPSRGSGQGEWHHDGENSSHNAHVGRSSLLSNSIKMLSRGLAAATGMGMSTPNLSTTSGALSSSSAMNSAPGSIFGTSPVGGKTQQASGHPNGIQVPLIGTDNIYHHPHYHEQQQLQQNRSRSGGNSLGFHVGTPKNKSKRTRNKTKDGMFPPVSSGSNMIAASPPPPPSHGQSSSIFGKSPVKSTLTAAIARSGRNSGRSMRRTNHGAFLTPTSNPVTPAGTGSGRHPMTGGASPAYGSRDGRVQAQQPQQQQHHQPQPQAQPQISRPPLPRPPNAAPRILPSPAINPTQLAAALASVVGSDRGSSTGSSPRSSLSVPALNSFRSQEALSTVNSGRFPSSSKSTHFLAVRNSPSSPHLGGSRSGERWRVNNGQQRQGSNRFLGGSVNDLNEVNQGMRCIVQH